MEETTTGDYQATARDIDADPKTLRVRITRGRIVLVADVDGGRAVVAEAPDEIHSNAGLINIQRARQWASELGFPCEV